MAIPKEVSIGSDVLKFFDRDRDYEDQRARLADIIDARIRSTHDDGKLRCDASSLRNQINESVIAATSGTLSDYFHTLAEIVAASDDLSSPLCLGNMTSVTPNFSSMLAELVVTLNQNLVKRDASHALTLLEQQVIADLHRLVYHSSDDFYQQHAQASSSTLGLVTQGGSLSNLSALWIARNLAFPPADDFPGVEIAGLTAALRRYNYERGVIIGSRLMHYSIEKAAGLLGLGAENVILLPVDQNQRMSVEALRQSVRDCVRHREKILAIVGTAGTSDCGSVDPLLQLAEVAREAEVFFHVDAAWGGPMLFSSNHSPLLAGISQADSVVIDGHKQLYTPIGTSILLLKRPHAARSIEKTSQYILQKESGDLGRHSVEGSRNGSILFLHAVLAVLGSEGLGFLIDENIRKARILAKLIRQSNEFELLFAPETSIVLYRYLPTSLRGRPTVTFTASEHNFLNEFNEQLQKAQSEAARTFVSRTLVYTQQPDRVVPTVALRAVIMNPLIKEEHLRFVLSDQATIGTNLEFSKPLESYAAAQQYAVG